MLESHPMQIQKKKPQTRMGIVLVLAAAMMIVVMGFAAFAIDVGFMVLTVDEMQNAADAAALAGAMRLNDGAVNVRTDAKDIALRNYTGKNAITMTDSDIELGRYDLATKVFTPDEVTPNAVRTTARTVNRNLYFAKVFGNTKYSTSAKAIAMINPRDIAFVVDLSGSMNDDTEPAWAPETINLEWASAGYPSIGTQLCNNLYSDLNFGTYPGTSEWIGQPLGVPNNTSCYYELQRYTSNGYLCKSTTPSTYKITSSDSVSTRKTKAYKWIIDQQLARLMPNARPTPSSSNSTSLAYWTSYLDYVILSKTVSSVKYPPNQDSDQMSGQNNPNVDTHPTTASNLPDKYRNFVGYRTYVQFLLDWGRDRTPTVANSTNADPSLTKTELSRFNTAWCRYVSEATPAGNFSFPPREQPTHAVRRAIIAALKVLEDQNSGIQDPWRDQVCIVTFDAIDAYHAPILAQSLTANYRPAMQVCTTFQAVGDQVASTATENGLIKAREHLSVSGGEGRVFSNKVVVLLTDGVPNLYQSSFSTVSNYINSHPSNQYYSNSSGNMPWNSVLMQSAIMKSELTQIYPVGTGVGADYSFMDKAAILNGTAKSGHAPQGTGNPAVYEAVLTQIFSDIIKGGRVRLVH